MQNLKCVLVGDGAMGKRCMVERFTTGAFPNDYIPTVFENYTLDISYKDKCLSLQLWLTAGQEEYERFRSLSYPQTDVFIVVYSVISPYSFDGVITRWIPEISHHCPGTPFILVGSKIDLRHDPDTNKRLAEKELKPITYQEGEDLARAIGAVIYAECSALTGEGIKELFTEIMPAAVLEGVYQGNSYFERRSKSKKVLKCIRKDDLKTLLKEEFTQIDIRAVLYIPKEQLLHALIEKKAYKITKHFIGFYKENMEVLTSKYKEKTPLDLAKATKNKKIVALLETTIQAAELKAKKEQEEAEKRAKTLAEQKQKEQQAKETEKKQAKEQQALAVKKTDKKNEKTLQTALEAAQPKEQQVAEKRAKEQQQSNAKESEKEFWQQPEPERLLQLQQATGIDEQDIALFKEEPKETEAPVITPEPIKEDDRPYRLKLVRDLYRQTLYELGEKFLKDTVDRLQELNLQTYLHPNESKHTNAGEYTLSAFISYSQTERDMQPRLDRLFKYLSKDIGMKVFFDQRNMNAGIGFTEFEAGRKNEAGQTKTGEGIDRSTYTLVIGSKSYKDKALNETQQSGVLAEYRMIQARLTNKQDTPPNSVIGLMFQGDYPISLPPAIEPSFSLDFRPSEQTANNPLNYVDKRFHDNSFFLLKTLFQLTDTDYETIRAAKKAFEKNRDDILTKEEQWLIDYIEQKKQQDSLKEQARQEKIQAVLQKTRAATEALMPKVSEQTARSIEITLDNVNNMAETLPAMQEESPKDLKQIIAESYKRQELERQASMMLEECAAKDAAILQAVQAHQSQTNQTKEEQQTIEDSVNQLQQAIGDPETFKQTLTNHSVEDQSRRQNIAQKANQLLEEFKKKAFHDYASYYEQEVKKQPIVLQVEHINEQIDAWLKARFATAIQLATGMARPTDTKGHIVAKGVGAMLSLLPVIGNLLGMAARSGIVMAAEKVQTSHYSNVLTIILSPSLGEQVAQKALDFLSRNKYYQAAMQETIQKGEGIKAVAQGIAETLYNYVAQGKLIPILLEQQPETVEERASLIARKIVDKYLWQRQWIEISAPKPVIQPIPEPVLIQVEDEQQPVAQESQPTNTQQIPDILEKTQEHVVQPEPSKDTKALPEPLNNIHASADEVMIVSAVENNQELKERDNVLTQELHKLKESDNQKGKRIETLEETIKQQALQLQQQSQQLELLQQQVQQQTQQLASFQQQMQQMMDMLTQQQRNIPVPTMQRRNTQGENTSDSDKTSFFRRPKM